MKATETNLLTLLNGKKQFLVPIYQRVYRWSTTQCKQLWNDIISVSAPESKGHFVGSVVYITEGVTSATLPSQFMVIDGQQRITTVSLLLLALRDAVKNDANESLAAMFNSINDEYIINSNQKNDFRYKLVLTQSDRDTYNSLVSQVNIDVSQGSKSILNNYNFFVGLIEEAIENNSISIEEIYNAIGKLLVVDISLDRNYDNPQLIFQSLNSTGLKLTQSDLIRNYVLMGLAKEEQEQLYNDYWYPMEKGFVTDTEELIFDSFMRDYLTMKLSRIPRINDVYEEFKSYIQKYTLSIFDVIKDIYQFSKYYTAILYQNTDDAKINLILEDIKALRMEVSYPFILAIFNDFNLGKIDIDSFVHILKMTESYVFRRTICGIPTNSLNKTFANLYNEIDKDGFLNSLKYIFITMDSYRNFPTDEIFKKELTIKDVYNIRLKNYLFRKLENFERKAPVNMANYSIEHIMPQTENLSDQWKKDLGDDWAIIHEKYLHTIGNLTLTDANSEMGAKVFTVKRDMPKGYKESALKLNKDIVTRDKWQEDEILARSERLAVLSTTIWKYPDLDKTIIETFQNELQKESKKYNLSSFEHLKNGVLENFNLLRKEILGIDSSVKEELKKFYIAYKAPSNFVDIIPQASGLKLSLNLKFKEVYDPQGLCKDISNTGKWGNGDVQLRLDKASI